HCADEAYDLALQTGREALEPQCLLARSRLALGRGDLDLARECAENARARVVESGRRSTLDSDSISDSLLGQIAAMAGDHAQAHQEFVSAIDAAEKYGKPAQHMLAELIEGDVHSLVALGQLEEASRELERLRTLAEDIDVPTVDALLARARASIADVEGDRAEAVRHAELAVRLFEDAAQEWPFQIARSLLSLGTVQRRAMQKRAARGA